MMLGLARAVRWLSTEVGLRFLARRKPGLFAAVLTMALAIGANTAVFSVVKAFLFSSLIVRDPQRVFAIVPVRDLPGQGSVAFSDAYPNFRLLRETQRLFSDVTCVFQGIASWDDGGEMRSLQFSSVTATFFPVMAQPALGRRFSREEEGPRPAAVVILSHALWQSAFAGDPRVLGTSMTLNDRPHTIVGVMAPGFAQPPPTDVWLPFDIPDRFWNQITGARQLAVYGRLARGVSRQAALAEMAEFSKRAIAADTANNRDYRYTLQTLRELLLAGADSTILVVQAGAALLLLLAVTNLTSVLIAWGFERQQETAVRLALGASQRRVFRQFLSQGLFVVGLAGVVGFGLAAAALPLIQRLNPNPALTFFLSGLRLDAESLLFGLALTLFTGIVAGVLPARYSRRAELAETLRSASRGASLSRRALSCQKAIVLSQGALSVIILCAAALVGLSFHNLSRVPDGFEAKDRVVLRFQLPEARYGNHATRAAFGRSLLANLQQRPDLAAFGFTSVLPVGDGAWGGRFFVELPNGEVVPEPVFFHYRRISANYLAAIGIPLLRGRHFEQRDEAGAPSVAIVSRALADRLWPRQDAIGKRIRRVVPGTTQTEPLEIVGVAGNTMDAGYNLPPGEAVYVPYDQVSVDRLSLVLRPRGTAAAAIAAARRALKGADPGLAASNIAPLEDLVWQANALPRLQVVLLAAFGLIAVGITALGSYGVMSQLVANREREFGVRLVVGAAPAELARSVLVQNARLSLAGIAIGLVTAWALGGLLRRFLLGVEPRSLLVLATVGAGTLALTLLATLAPALRAMRLDVNRVVGAG